MAARPMQPPPSRAPLPARPGRRTAGHRCALRWPAAAKADGTRRRRRRRRRRWSCWWRPAALRRPLASVGLSSPPPDWAPQPSCTGRPASDEGHHHPHLRPHPHPLPLLPPLHLRPTSWAAAALLGAAGGSCWPTLPTPELRLARRVRPCSADARPLPPSIVERPTPLR